MKTHACALRRSDEITRNKNRLGCIAQRYDLLIPLSIALAAKLQSNEKEGKKDSTAGLVGVML